jgi:DNA-binding CsgD family transcriptional regulator
MSFRPTTEPSDAAKQLEGGNGSALPALLTALCSEPATGVTIVSLRGRVVFRNVQAARIFHENETDAQRVLGLYWHDYMPLEWVRERLMLLRSISEHGKPALMRTIWRDAQHFTWIYPIDGARDGNDPLFLLITRRVSSAEQADVVAHAEVDVVHSNVMRLSTLASLSSRELEVLALLGRGLTNGEAANELGLSERTIDNHRAAIYTKLGISDRAQLLTIAARAGLKPADAERKRV